MANPKSATDSEKVTKKPNASTKAKTVKKSSPSAKKAAVKKPAMKKAAAKATTKKPNQKTAAKPKKPTQKSESTKKATAKPEEKTMSAHTESPKISEASNQESNDFIDELKNRNWGEIVVRGLFMIVFSLIASFAIQVVLLLVLIQFILAALTSKPSSEITGWISWTAKWLVDTLNFLSYKTEDKPFPLN